MLCYYCADFGKRGAVMRKNLLVSVSAFVAAGWCAAIAGTYIPVPMVPGAVSQIVFAINNHNVVAGSFRDANNIEHGFFGPLDGSNYTAFDFPGDGTTGTEPRYINDKGAIDGFATNPNFQIGEEFYRSPSGVFKVFQIDGQPLDGVAQGMNDDGTNMGDYYNNEGERVGYRGRYGVYKNNFGVHLNGHKHFSQVSPRGITDLGNVTVGQFLDQSGVQYGFFQEDLGKGKFALVINYPNATSASLEDINDSLMATGQRTDSKGNSHAFQINLEELQNIRIKDLNPRDGSTYQQAWGINDHGLVALSTSTGMSYIYCPKKNPDKCPAGGVVNDLTTKPPLEIVQPDKRHGGFGSRRPVKAPKGAAIQ